MRLLFCLLLMPAPALAHTGHLGEVAGHDHWVAGAAVGIAIGIGLWQAAKDRKRRKHESEGDQEDAPEEQTA